MSLYKLNFKSSYEAQIISCLSHRLAYPVEAFIHMMWLGHKWDGKFEVSMPRISYRTNIFQLHTCHTF